MSAVRGINLLSLVRTQASLETNLCRNVLWANGPGSSSFRSTPKTSWARSGLGPAESGPDLEVLAWLDWSILRRPDGLDKRLGDLRRIAVRRQR